MRGLQRCTQVTVQVLQHSPAINPPSKDARCYMFNLETAVCSAVVLYSVTWRADYVIKPTLIK